MDDEPRKISLREYYGIVWEKASELENRSWARHAVGTFLPVFVGLACLAPLFGWVSVLDGQRMGWLIGCFGLIGLGLRNLAWWLLKAPAVLYYEEKDKVNGLEKRLRESEQALATPDDVKEFLRAMIEAYRDVHKNGPEYRIEWGEKMKPVLSDIFRESHVMSFMAGRANNISQWLQQLTNDEKLLASAIRRGCTVECVEKHTKELREK